MIRQGVSSATGNHNGTHPGESAGAPADRIGTTLRALLIVGRAATRDWIASTLVHDRAARIDLTAVRGMSAALRRLRESAFDIVLAAYEPGGLESLESISAIKTGSHEQQAVLVLSDAPMCELDAWCLESGADGYVCLRATTARALWCQMVRAVEHQRLTQENHRLRQQLFQQRNADRDEVERVLQSQRALAGGRPSRGNEAMASRYQPILRAYVMLHGPGLDQELAQLTRDFQAAGITGRDFLDFHSQAVELITADLAGRGARHILHRAAVLALDVLLRLSSE